MGRILLISRLAARDLRRRPAEAALLLLAIMAATTTLTLGLVLHGVTEKPYQSTREATAGPDVVASVPRPDGGEPADLAGLEALTDAPGVTGHSGPYPVTAGATLRGTTANRRRSRVDGRDTAPASVDQPKLTQGSWVRDGGVVVEAGFADALGVDAGDPITLQCRRPRPRRRRATPRRSPLASPCRVVPDVCVGCCGRRPLRCRIPRCPASASASERGLVWLTRADARSLAPQEDPLAYVSYLKLADPAAAPAFVDERNLPGRACDRPVPAGVAGDQRRERQPGGEPAAGAADGRLAARPARRGERGRPRRRPDGRPDPARRTAQGGRRHTGPSRRRAARRVRRRGPARGGGRAGARMAGRSTAHRSQRRPPRPRGCAVAHRVHGRRW